MWGSAVAQNIRLRTNIRPRSSGLIKNAINSKVAAMHSIIVRRGDLRNVGNFLAKIKKKVPRAMKTTLNIIEMSRISR